MALQLGAGRTLLHRARISELLTEATRCPVAFIIAPAGCGKSAALDQFLAAAETTVVRFDARQEHGKYPVLIRGLAQAISRIAPRASATVAEALLAAQALEHPARALSAWLVAQLADFDGIIAIDDFHLVDADPESSACLARTIERTTRCRWVIAARHLQHLPVGGWVAKGIADPPIDDVALSFTQEEIREAAALYECTLDAAGIEEIGRLTAGWAAGTSIALRTARHSSDIERVAVTTRRLTFQYLDETVFAPLGAREKELLLFCGLLPEIDIGVLEKAGYRNVRATLGSLFERIALVSPTFDSAHSATTTRYRCHDLLRDFLKHRLALEEPSVSFEMLVRAAAALECCERVSDALVLFSRAGDAEAVVRILSEHGIALEVKGHAEAIASAIKALPVDVHGSDPVVLAFRGFKACTENRPFARSLLESAYAGTSDYELRGSIALRLAGLQLQQGELPVDLLESHAFDEAMPRATRAGLLTSLAIAYSRSKRIDSSARIIQSIEALVQSGVAEAQQAIVLWQFGTTLTILNHFAQGRAMLASALPLALADGLYAVAVSIYLNLSVAAYDVGDMDEAFGCASRAYETSLEFGSPRRTERALVYLVRFALVLGDEVEIDRCFSRAQPYDLLASGGRWHLAVSMRDAFNGKFDHICPPEYIDAPVRAYSEVDVVDLACCALMSAVGGRLEQCDALLRSLDQLAQSRSVGDGCSPLQWDITLALAALAEALLGRLHLAGRRLRLKALTQSPIVSAMRSFVGQVVRAHERSTAVGDLSPHLERLRTHGCGGYAKLLEAAVGKVEAARPFGAQLTRAELEILRALAAGSKPKEIAHERGSGTGTVRTQIARIIAKFGCSGSEGAIAMARSQGLL